MSIIAALGASLAFMCAMMALAWGMRMKTGQSGWIDAIWSLSSGAAGVGLALLAMQPQSQTVRMGLAAALVALWAGRLGGHIAMRAAKGGDDPRYADLAKQWGDAFPRRLFLFLQIQALCGFGLALAVFAGAHNPRPAPDLRDLVAALILLGAILGEGLADSQLRRFAADPANKAKVCDVGLWSWSRHPNYFCEWLGWLAWPVMAIDPSGGWAWGWASLLAPALIYWLLVHASGIPPLEAHMLRSRGRAFRDYMARTNAFFPWPPRSRS